MECSACGSKQFLVFGEVKVKMDYNDYMDLPRITKKALTSKKITLSNNSKIEKPRIYCKECGKQL